MQLAENSTSSTLFYSENFFTSTCKKNKKKKTIFPAAVSPKP